MKVNTQIVTQAALNLLNKVGLEELTLRLLARELDVQAASIYWHFKNKRELLDAMSSTILTEGPRRLGPSTDPADWSTWIATFGVALRQNLLVYRDGARLVS